MRNDTTTKNRPTHTAYTVHVYREMRVVFTGIAASTNEEAARIAMARPSDSAESFEDCEGRTFSALIDVVGDTEHSQSSVVDAEEGRLLDAAPKLLRFLTDFVAFGYDPSGRDHWDGMGQFLERARRLLRQSKGRSPV
jgi:hypothetical protein